MQVAADPVALLLDKAWYRFTYPDVAASGIEPLDHWLAFGCNEKRQPNFYFEPLWYLQQNPDVVGSGLDPLLHYALFGEAEGQNRVFFRSSLVPTNFYHSTPRISACTFSDIPVNGSLPAVRRLLFRAQKLPEGH